MKKTLTFILVFMLSFSTIGCTSSSNNLEAIYDNYQTVIYPSEYSQSEILAMVDNETLYDELITEEIDIHYVVEKYFAYGGVNVNQQLTIHHIIDDIKIECLRENWDGLLYSIHKVKQGGLLYMFYKNEAYELANGKFEGTFSGEFIEWFYVCKDRKFDDYLDYIKDGTSFTKLLKYEPVAQLYDNIRNAESNVISPIYEDDFSVSLYLQDGILRLHYIKDKKGNFVLDKKLFDPTYTIYDTYYDDIEHDTMHKGALLDIDKIM